MGCFCKKVRTLHCKVVLLDEQELVHEIQENSPGREVLDTVFRHLNLLETAYFGLRYLDTANQPHWLDPAKKVARALNGTLSCTLYFGVKFYAADPCKLLEEITRYQFYLQVKQDILQGRLPVTFDLAAELGAYVVQSELGDYDFRRHSPGYVSEFRFVSNQTAELESRIAEIHKGLVGQLPAEAELAYLNRVKWLDMYGVDLHPVLGEDNVEYFLGLTPSGIVVLRNKNKVGNYYWPRITKIYFKGRYFMLRVCDKNNEESTYGFETPSRAACKQLWKCCVEHHAFFRLLRVSPAPQDIFRLSSRFRYSGRTEKEAQRDAQAGVRVPPNFERSPSRRQQRRVVEGAAHNPTVEEVENIPPSEKMLNSFSTPVPAITSSISTDGRRRASSPPLSTRSAPWAEPVPRGLYQSAAVGSTANGGASPRSLRSAASTGRLGRPMARPSRQGASGRSHGSRSQPAPQRRSSSIESRSSADSRPCHRHRHRHNRRNSDSESEASKCSERCSSRCRHRRHHHRSRRKSSTSNTELVDSTNQWAAVQRKQAEAGVNSGAATTGSTGSRVQKATVVSSRRSGYANSGADTEVVDTPHGRHRRRLRTKHRSRSRSPTEEASTRMPAELKRHLDFSLVDTTNMSEEQRRQIPYTVVRTDSKPPTTRRRGHHSHSRRQGNDDHGSSDRLSVSSQPTGALPMSNSVSSLTAVPVGSTLSLASRSARSVGQPHRVVSTAALSSNPSATNSPGIPHRNLKRYNLQQASLPPQALRLANSASCDQLEEMSSGSGIASLRQRSNLVSQPPPTPSPQGSGTQSPYGSRIWDEGRAPGSRTSSGRGSSASSSLRTSSRTMRGPLCFQQQLQSAQIQEKEQQQHQNPCQSLQVCYQRTSLRSHVDNTSSPTIKSAPRWQNSPYGSLLRNDPALNGNVPPHGTDYSNGTAIKYATRTDVNPSYHIYGARTDFNTPNGRGPYTPDANAETCTEL